MNLTESCRVVQGNRGVLNEWTYEGGRKPVWQVAADGTHPLQCDSYFFRMKFKRK